MTGPREIVVVDHFGGMQPEGRKRPSGCGSSAGATSLPSGGHDAHVTASALERQTVSIVDALTVNLVSAAAR